MSEFLLHAVELLPNGKNGLRSTPERSGPQKLGLNVWTARKRVEKLRYMHRNPVQRGLVASPELWRWSSFRAYLFGEAGPVAVNKWDVLKMKIRTPAA
jgi:putative transposase